VRHPYVEAGIDKAGLRNLARQLGLGAVAELPASPCLASRVETAIPIDPEALLAVDAVERLVIESLGVQTVRCRIRRAGVVIELDAPELAALHGDGELIAAITALLPSDLARRPIAFEPYRRGSAFLGAGA